MRSNVLTQMFCWLALVVLLTACRAPTALPAAPPASPTAAQATALAASEPAPMATPVDVFAGAATPSPTLEQSSSIQPSPMPPAPPAAARLRPTALADLLAYLDPGLADYTGPNPLGPMLIFMDIARMRHDLGLPPVGGASPRSAKLSLLSQLKNAEPYLTMGLLPNTASSAFAEWGWDIADVDQVLACKQCQTILLLGDFSRSEIRQALERASYSGHAAHGFTFFANANKAQQFALRDDALFIAEGKDSKVLEDLVARQASGGKGLGGVPGVAALLPRLQEAWGASLASAGDVPAWVVKVRDDSPSDIPDLSRAFARFNGQPEIAWDLLGIGWWGSADQPTRFRFLYHYPADDEAQRDVEAASTGLRNMPTLYDRGRTWADMLKLEEVTARDRVLEANATTINPVLIRVTTGRPDLGFVPVRFK